MFGNVNVSYKPCKTSSQLKAACDYILGKKKDQLKSGTIKTLPNLYSAFDDDRDNFDKSVLLTRRLWDKPCTNKRSNLAYKMSISFHPEEKLTYEEAFKISKEFADKYFHSKGYDVLFAVHVDREHIHTHFIIGNCNRDTGKSFRRNEHDLYEMSEFFGQQCIDHGLTRSVREDYYSKNPWQIKLSFNEAQMAKKGKESFKDELREAIDHECRDIRNHSFEDVMKALMDHYHVETRVKGNTVSYRHPEYKNKNGELVSVRGSKLGEPYTKRGIENVIEELRRERKLGGEFSCQSGGSDTIRTERRDAEYCINESGQSRRSSSGQGSSDPSYNCRKDRSHEPDLYGEYARKVRSAERKPVIRPESTERIREKRKGLHL